DVEYLDSVLVLHLLALDPDLFLHLSFADFGIGDFPDLALIIQEHRVSALLGARKVAGGLFGVLLYAFLVTEGAGHFSSFALVPGRDECTHTKSQNHQYSYSFHMFVLLAGMNQRLNVQSSVIARTRLDRT